MENLQRDLAAIGVHMGAENAGVFVGFEHHRTGTVADDALEHAIHSITKLGKLTPRGIRTHLALNKPIYAPTAAYGHFGRTSVEGIENAFTWERTDRVEQLLTAVAG